MTSYIPRALGKMEVTINVLCRLMPNCEQVAEIADACDDPLAANLLREFVAATNSRESRLALGMFRDYCGELGEPIADLIGCELALAETEDNSVRAEIGVVRRQAIRDLTDGRFRLAEALGLISIFELIDRKSAPRMRTLRQALRDRAISADQAHAALGQFFRQGLAAPVTNVVTIRSSDPRTPDRGGNTAERFTTGQSRPQS